MRKISNSNLIDQPELFAFVKRVANQWPHNTGWPSRQWATFKAVLALARMGDTERGKHATVKTTPTNILRCLGSRSTSGRDLRSILEALDGLHDPVKSGSTVKRELPALILKMTNRNGVLHLTVNKWWLTKREVDRVPVLTPPGRVACNLQLLCSWMATNAGARPATAKIDPRRFMMRVGARDRHDLARSLASLNAFHLKHGLPRYVIAEVDGKFVISQRKALTTKKVKRVQRKETHAELLARLNAAMQFGPGSERVKAQAEWDEVMNAQAEQHAELMSE